jgi:hypothetical protein
MPSKSLLKPNSKGLFWFLVGWHQPLKIPSMETPNFLAIKTIFAFSLLMHLK